MTEAFREKVLRKCGESMEMKEKFFANYADSLDEMSRALAATIREWRATLRRWATAAASATRCISRSSSITRSSKSGLAFPAIPLMTDIATMTAISNDLDFTRVYVNQLRLQGWPATSRWSSARSGKSPNLIYALEDSAGARR